MFRLEVTNCFLFIGPTKNMANVTAARKALISHDLPFQRKTMPLLLNLCA